MSGRKGTTRHQVYLEEGTKDYLSTVYPDHSLSEVLRVLIQDHIQKVEQHQQSSSIPEVDVAIGATFE